MYIYIYIYIYTYIYIYICENEIWNLSPKKHYAFSTETSRLPTFWILPKLQELCESCR